MDYIIFHIILFVILVITPIGFILHKTRILYPLLYIDMIIVIHEHKTWFIHKLLDTTIGEIISLVLLFIIIICSVISAIKQFIRIFNYSFEWRDIPRHFQRRKAEKAGRLPYQVESKLTQLFPQVAEDKYFFENNCRTEMEKLYFSLDWKEYIYILEEYYDSEHSYIGFEEWFEISEKWKSRTYNHFYTDKLNIQKQEELKQEYRNSFSQDTT